MGVQVSREARDQDRVVEAQSEKAGYSEGWRGAKGCRIQQGAGKSMIGQART